MTINRLNYATGQLLTAQDFQDEQDYHRNQRLRHNQSLHTPGVGSGLDFVDYDKAHVTISPGYAIDSSGQEIVVLEPVTLAIADWGSAAAVFVTIQARIVPDPTDAAGFSKRTAEQADLKVVLSIYDPVNNTYQLPADNTAIPLGRLTSTGGGVHRYYGDRKLASAVVSSPLPMPLGIGVSNPVSALSINAAIGSLGGGTPGGAAIALGNTAQNPTQFVQGNDDGNVSIGWGFNGAQASINAKGGPLVLQQFSGNVGIGNSAPQGMLHIGSTTGIDPNIYLSGVPGNGENGLRLHYNHDTGANVAVMDVKGGAFAIRGESGVGTGITERFAIKLDTGNVGIGTPGPQQKLHVAGNFVLVDGGANEQAYFGGDGGAYDYYVDGNNNRIPLYDVQIGSFNPAVSRVTLVNLASPQSYMDLTCRNVTCNSFTGKKIGYVVDQFVNASGDLLSEGDLVIISKNQASLYYGPHDVPVPEVDLSSTAYDTKVCGIVADAQATSPHELRSLQGAAEYDGPPLEERQIGHMATLGAFAHCKVDADIAAIEIGDLLTTSPTPGHAQKVLDRSQAIGAIVGKALAPLQSGKGKIAVMVMMQ